MRSSSVFGADRALLRRATATLLGLSLIVGLTACTPLKVVAVRIVDDEMVFVICDRVKVEEFVVLVKQENDKDAELVTYWDASGDGSFGGSDPVTYGVAPDGFESSMEPRPLPLENARIAFDAIQPGGRSSVEGVFVAADISADYWLQHGGGHTSEPCD
jgi:hypothetical protein